MGWGDRASGAPATTPTSAPVGGWGSRTTAPEPTQTHSLGHNLLHGAGQALGSLPHTLAVSAEATAHDINLAVNRPQDLVFHPTRSSAIYKKEVVPAAHQYAYQYGPLTHGDFNEFYARFHANPLPVILDAATIASFGAGRVAALSALPKGASRAEVAAALRTGETQGPLRTVTARLSPESEPIPTRTLPRKAFRAGRIQGVDAALKQLPATTPMVGEYARAARAVRREALPTKLVLLHDRTLAEQQRAFGGLTVAQRAAVNAIARWPKVEDAQAVLQNLHTLGHEDSALAQELGNPAVWKAYTERTPKVMKAVELGRQVADLREKVLLRTGAIQPETVAEAAYRHTRLARGGRFLPKGAAARMIGQVDKQLAGLQRQKGRLLKQGRKLGMPSLDEAVAEARALDREAERLSTRRARLAPIAANTDAFRAEAHALRDEVANVSAGNIDTATLDRLGINLPRTEEAGTNMQRAFFDAHKRAEADRLRSELDDLRRTRERIGNGEARTDELLSLGVRLSPRVDLAKGLQRARAVADKRIAALEKTQQRLLTAPEAKVGLEATRLKALGQLHDRMGDAYVRYERALVAEYAHERATIAGIMNAARQSGSKAKIAAAREMRIRLLQAQRRRFSDLLEVQRQLIDLGDEIASSAGRIYGGPKVEELRAEFEREGLPQPYYVHDIAEQGSNRSGVGNPSGVTPPRAGADVRQSHGTLVETGRLLLHPDVTGPAFIRAAKHEWYLKTHDLVKQIAVRIPVGDGLPKGMRWVREVRGQHIPYLETAAGENMAELHDALRALPEQQSLTLRAGEDTAAAAVGEEGGVRYRLAVPDAFARGMDAEFRSANRVVDFLERYPLAVWRALVLKVRVPWLLGNIFGNAILATLRFAGANGMRAVLGMIRTTNGAMAVRRALKMGEESGALTAADVDRLLPEISRGGTFIGANLPSLGSERLIRLAPTALEPILRKTHRLGSAIVDFLPHIDKATEGALRRGGANKVLLSSPEVKALVKKGLTPRAAMTRALETSEDFRRLVVKEVNDGLGDYLSMSHLEQTHVRSLIPFYAWLREITRITLRLPLDYPGRSALIAHLASAYQTAGQYPSFLSGFIPTGQPQAGVQSGINLTAYNPFQSGADTLSALGTLTVHPTPRGASSLLGSLNPTIPAAFDYLDKARKGEPVPNLGLLAASLANVGQALPEARVVSNPPSRLYPGRTREDLLKQFFGDPRRRVSVSVAEQYARQGK